ncbi:MAG: GtrA family protein, partial [Bacteroides sp.]|nr:GtrA family protein [Bacteroides sp.]
MRESRRILRFAIIGTLNALITAVVIWMMMDVLNVDYMFSNITAYVIAQTHNFIWCKHWIFPLDKEKKGNTWKQVLLLSLIKI